MKISERIPIKDDLVSAGQREQGHEEGISKYGQYLGAFLSIFGITKKIPDGDYVGVQSIKKFYMRHHSDCTNWKSVNIDAAIKYARAEINKSKQPAPDESKKVNPPSVMVEDIGLNTAGSLTIDVVRAGTTPESRLLYVQSLFAADVQPPFTASKLNEKEENMRFRDECKKIHDKLGSSDQLAFIQIVRGCPGADTHLFMKRGK